MKFCQRQEDCTNVDHCHQNDNIKNYFGVCAPMSCQNGKCDTFGDAKLQGSLSGTCRNGKCDYSAPLMMATNQGLEPGAGQGNNEAGEGLEISGFLTRLFLMIIVVLFLIW